MFSLLSILIEFCICGDVEHGQMIACDGDNCPVEWFHMNCIGLNEVPDGSWFCSFCKKHDV